VTEWIHLILETLAIVSVFLGTTIVLMMTNVVVKRTGVLTKRREEIIMADKQSESVTFNDVFMFLIAVPLVLLWVSFAGYVIWTGLANPGVLDQIESYTTLIAILGGPALLIIKDALDVWKNEQESKTEFYKTKAQSIIDFNQQAQTQAQMIETKQQEHEHKKK
tara:strand:+ start:236 stop:727 length:492 start_codon:yes stop_codon:yes gene_type:complete